MGSITHSEALAYFKSVGVIELEGDRLSVSIHADCPPDPAVYAWVEVSGAFPVILYVGKAGYGIAARHRQHSAGFRNSVRGKGHDAFLRELLAAGAWVEVWGSWPPEVKVFGQMIAAHSSWEDHLVDNLEPRPTRNRT